MTFQGKFWLWAAIAFGAAAIAGVVIGKTVPASGGVENPALVLPMLLMVVALVSAATWVWWQKTDDIQQQGQLISWWWGGTFGALAMLVVLVVMTGRHSEISLGATYLFLAEFAGFAVVWCVWKLRGRGPAE
ncbi:hypothetical protein FGU71_02795 [Erythrobacter insulae]|uniref:Uncharacterized protein n=1 Tax=Erythrobacter insulae TaxID=2584124 RepID=A0A547PA25_9SPHN|nr:hypothetical protein [Erythrobacter insulae]TRD10894.1 hypothetical protein FGU71_02795 [Erythrobacter insulae]